MVQSDENLPEDNSQKAPASSGRKISFIEKILSFFMGRDNPEEEKKKLLRDIGKTISRLKQKFYSPKKELALPGLALYIYEFYKLLGPAKNLVQRSKSSVVLKEIIIESTLTNEQHLIKEKLNEDSIRARLKNKEQKIIEDQIREELITFISGFDSDKAKSINFLYNMMATFLDFIHFDYYFFLKKFDSQIQEDNFFYNPRFEAINSEYILDDIKEFYELVISFNPDANWNAILDNLKMYRNIEVVSRKGWKKGLQKLMELKRSKVFNYIIKHIDKDPFYNPKPIIHREKIVDQYLQKIKTETELILQKIIKEKRNSNIQQLTIEVFGTASISRMKNYTEKENITYRKKMMGGFIHVTALNILKAFLLDYFKGEIRDVIDLLIIKGKWSSNVSSQQVSECLHQIFKVSDRLLEFDESVSEEGDIGRKLRATFYKSDRDKTLVPHVRKMLKEINERGKQIIVDAAQNIVTMGKHIKYLIDDYAHKKSNYIINWKEIDNKSDGKIQSKLISVYKKIFFFVKLLRHYLK